MDDVNKPTYRVPRASSWHEVESKPTSRWEEYGLMLMTMIGTLGFGVILCVVILLIMRFLALN